MPSAYLKDVDEQWRSGRRRCGGAILRAQRTTNKVHQNLMCISIKLYVIHTRFYIYLLSIFTFCRSGHEVIGVHWMVMRLYIGRWSTELLLVETVAIKPIWSWDDKAYLVLKDDYSDIKNRRTKSMEEYSALYS